VPAAARRFDDGIDMLLVRPRRQFGHGGLPRSSEKAPLSGSVGTVADETIARIRRFWRVVSGVYDDSDCLFDQFINFLRCGRRATDSLEEKA
jgi:hypothetical protein